MTRKPPKAEQRMPIVTRENLRLRAALGSMQRRVRELTKEKEASQREVAELRRAVAEQTEYLDALAARVELVSGRDDDLRAMLAGAHEQLMNRADEIRTTLAAELQQAVLQQNAPQRNMPEGVPSPVRATDLDFVPNHHSSYQELVRQIHYRRLVRRIQETVHTALPPGATVAVASKGDEELLELGEGRRGWHFPQNEEGVYAGYYPADSEEAISHLEELRSRGAQFLLFPGTAFWWLEEYEEFGRHLRNHYRVALHQEDACIIFALQEPKTGWRDPSLQGNRARTAPLQDTTA